MVERLVGEIEAGEAFQVVPSQRFEMDTDVDPLDVYRMLRVSNPSPYMYLLHVPNESGETDFSIVGSSPEALVTVTDGWRRRIRSQVPGGAAERTKKITSWRRSCCPTRRNAEHLMLVDLGVMISAGSVYQGPSGSTTTATSSATAMSCIWCRRSPVCLRPSTRHSMPSWLVSGRNVVGRAEGPGHGVDRGGGRPVAVSTAVSSATWTSPATRTSRSRFAPP